MAYHVTMARQHDGLEHIAGTPGPVVDGGGDRPELAPSLTERRMARTRRALAEAAGRLFLAQGYDETTVEDIAAAAEVSPRTFFRYFEHKDGVATAIAQLGIGDVLEAFAARVASEPVWAALRGAVADVLSAGPPGSPPRDPKDGRAFVSLLNRTPALRSRWLDEVHQQVPAVAGALQAHVTALAGDALAARVAAGAIFAALIVALEEWANDDDCTLDDALARCLRVLGSPVLPGA